MLDDLLCRSVEIHNDDDLIARLVRQLNAMHISAVNPTHLYVSSRGQARNIVELRLQLVGGAKQILLAPDDENTGGQNGQRRNDKCSQPCHSRHNSSYDCCKNSFTKPISLC